jgi:hypothetical protein
MLGGKVVGGLVVDVHFVGIEEWRVLIPVGFIPPNEDPVVAHLLRRAVRCGIGHEQRDKEYTKGARSERRIEGLGVERFASNGHVAGALECRKGAAGGHCPGHCRVGNFPSASQVRYSGDVRCKTFSTGENDG